MNYIIPKEELETLYIEKQYSTVEIGKIYNLPHWTINKLLKKYKIQIRSKSDCQKTTRVLENTKLTNNKKYGTNYPGSNVDIIKKRNKTIKEKYGVDNIFQNDNIKNKIKLTCMERYGVENPMKHDSIKKSLRETIKEKYGVDNVFQNVDIKNKSNVTKFDKYGDSNFNNINKRIETCNSKYGVSNYSETEECKEKVKRTNIEKYGCDHYSKTEEFKVRVKDTLITKYGDDYSNILREKSKESYKNKTGFEYPLQNPVCQRKTLINGLRKKEYIFPSGRTEFVQGYEPFVLDILLKDGIIENDILVGTTNVPTIKYIDKNNRSRTHFPDIFIISSNTLIEVKNEYYVSQNKDFLLYRKNIAISMGFNYKILVYNKKTKGIYEVN